MKDYTVNLRAQRQRIWQDHRSGRNRAKGTSLKLSGRAILSLLDQSYFQYTAYIPRRVTSYFINIHGPNIGTSGLPKLLLHRTLWNDRYQPANREITPDRLTKSFEIPLKLRDKRAFRRVERNGNFGLAPKRVDLNEFLRGSRIPRTRYTLVGASLRKYGCLGATRDEVLLIKSRGA